MNVILQLLLPLLNLAFVALVATGKVKVSWFPKEPAQQSNGVAEVVAPVVEKRKRGRPPKTKTHYLHLPPNLSPHEFQSATEFFQNYKDKRGDRVILHLSSGKGEETIEIPYTVRWDDQMKERFEMATWKNAQ